MTHGFGIIGCGMIAGFHARAIADIRAAKLIGCFDAVPAAADRLADQTGCRAHHRLGDLLADGESHLADNLVAPDPVPLFFFALALGYLYQRTHRLAPSVALHVAFNAIPVISFWLVSPT